MTDPRIAVLSALSSPGWHPVPEAHGMPWDEAEELLAAYDASRGAAAPSAPADRAALRDRIAELFRCPPGVEHLGDATPGEIADAVMVLLAEPVDIDPPHERAARYAAAGNEMAASLVRDGFGDDEIAAMLNGSADEVAPARHTCRDRTTAAGPDWQCPHCSTLPSRMAVEAQQPETQAEDPARIDRLRPEFFEHASVESIDVQIQRAQRQQRQWGNRLQTLTILRQARVMQKELGEWPAAAAQPGKEATQ
jgi:hypothetical protein